MITATTLNKHKQSSELYIQHTDTQLDKRNSVDDDVNKNGTATEKNNCSV